jgi:hypothetical protein
MFTTVLKACLLFQLCILAFKVDLCLGVSGLLQKLFIYDHENLFEVEVLNTETGFRGQHPKLT